jgi:uncharacterized cofD-like protein
MARPGGATALGSVVAIGGGSGLSVLLRGLKHHVAGGGLADLTAVVTVADDGGSSGRLRRDFGMPPPGDIRACLVALADDEHLLARLFQYRFAEGEGLSGHSFGNLFLTALTGVTGDFYRAVVETGHILSVRGRILPSTLENVRLRGLGVSGRPYEGESAVGRSGERMSRLELDPPAPEAFSRAVAAVAQADVVVLGPGSLYTSVLPNLLIPRLREAVQSTAAPVVMLMNLMTQPGETDGMDAADHLEAIRRHVGDGLVDAVLVNSTPPRVPLLTLYEGEGAVPVYVDERRMADWRVEVIAEDLLADGDLIRHDSAKLAGAVLRIAHRCREAAR